MSTALPARQRADAALQQFRFRAFRVVSGGLTALIVALGVYNLFTGEWQFLLADAVAIAVFLGVGLGVKRLGLEAGTYILVGGGIIAASFNAAQTMGLWHGTSDYLTVMPVLAGLLGGRRPAVVCGVASLFVLGGFLAAHATLAIPVPLAIPDGVTPLAFTTHHQVVDRTAILLGCTIVTYAFVSAQERSLRLWSDAADEAEHARSAQARFLAGMSHELRTPLHGVIGSLQLVRADAVEGEDARLIGIARSSADVLLSLINNVLDFSRLEAGRVEPDPTPTDPRALLRDTAAPIQVLAENKGVALVLEVDPGVPDQVLLDDHKTQQVLLNLAGNAVKFTEQGEVRVAARWSANTLEITVQDTGIGMTPEQQSTLFEAFVQADASVSRRFGGTGLGLAIVSGLVAVMEGHIEVQSEVGVGSTFTVSLPAPVADAPVQDHSMPGCTDHLRLLVVDDNPVNLTVLATMLERLGHEVQCAAGGEEAVALAAERRFDVVLMDVHMPDVDGLEATRRIRGAEPADRRVPIFALTASPDAEHRTLIEEADMDGLLGKPISFQELDRALHSAVA